MQKFGRDSTHINILKEVALSFSSHNMTFLSLELMYYRSASD